MAPKDLYKITPQCGEEGYAPPSKPEIPAGRTAFFGNRICPFAMRGWAALNVHGFKVVPADRADSDPDAILYYHINLGEDKPAWYVDFHPEATVPALIAADGTQVHGSEEVMRWAFAHSKIPEGEGRTADLPAEGTAEHDALKPLAAVIPASYKLLKAHSATPDDFRALVAAATSAYDALEAAYASGGALGPGPFLNGSPVATAGDISLLPFVDRFLATLEHYRGFDVLAGRPALARAVRMAQATALDGAAQSPVFYIRMYRGYGLPAEAAEAIKADEIARVVG